MSETTLEDYSSMEPETFDDKKQSLYSIEQTIDVKNNPVIKMTIIPILKSVPILGEVIDNSIDVALTNFQNKKREQLLDVILSQQELITSDRVNDIEFIMNFAKTLEAVNKLSTTDKVIYFGNLLKNSYFTDEKINSDLYQEYLRILDDISYREIGYLCFLYKNKKMSKRWSTFRSTFAKTFGVDDKSVYSIFYRLKRTGFVDEVLSFSPGTISGDEESGFEMDSGDIDTDYFFTTPLFEDFLKKIAAIV